MSSTTAEKISKFHHHTKKNHQEKYQQGEDHDNFC